MLLKFRGSNQLVDATWLIVISTVVQTVVITVTLVIFVLQFRSQEKAIKEASYQGLMGRYNDFIHSLIEKPELARFLMDDPDGSGSEMDAAVYAHLLVAYGIIEEAYLLYRKHWIDEYTWQQWSAWLKSIAARPELRSIRSRTAGTFDSEFENYVSHLLKSTDESPKPSQKERLHVDSSLSQK